MEISRQYMALPPLLPRTCILSHDTVIYSYAPIDEIDTDRDSLPLGALTPCLVPQYSRINPSACQMIGLGTALLMALLSPPKLLSQESQIRLALSAVPYTRPDPPCPLSSRPCALYYSDITRPLAATSSPQGRHRTLRRHIMAMPSSPRNCSMLPGLTLCTPCIKEHEAFGAVHT